MNAKLPHNADQQRIELGPINAIQQRIELWSTARPRPYGRNPRRCPPQAIEKVAASIAAFGFRSPILVDGAGEVIAGHTRLLAARKLGLARVPVIVCNDLAPEKVRALRLADNRSAQETSWDGELLGLEISNLAAADFTLDVLGFEADELAALLASPTVGLTDPDELPQAPAEPLSRVGDLWRLGAHRLLCGDATKAEQVRRLMDDQRAVLMITDPPYLVNYDGGNHPPNWGKDGRRISAAAKTKHWDHYQDPQTSVEFYSAFLGAARTEALAERPALYQFLAMMRIEIALAAWRANDLYAHQVAIWYKSRPVLGRCWFMYDYEPCLVGWIEGHQPPVSRRPPNNARAVWQVEQRAGIEEGAAHDHPTMKPVELIRRAIEWHTRAGELLYEPFAGSGTALIAAEMTGRCCYALEISPSFCDVAIARWQNFTGKQAVRDSAGD